MAASGAEASEQKISELEGKKQDDGDDHNLLENAVAESKVADTERAIEQEERKSEGNGEQHHEGDTSDPIGEQEEETHGDEEVANQAEAEDKEEGQARSATDADQKGDDTSSSSAAAAAGDFDENDHAGGSAQPDTTAAVLVRATDTSPEDEDDNYNTAAAAAAAREEKSNAEPGGLGSGGESKGDDGLVEEVVAAAAAADNNNLEQQQGSLSEEGKRDGGTSSDSAGAPFVQRPQAPEWPAYCNPTYRMPAELDVRVLIDGEVKSIPVKVERSDEQKLFQGGHWHKVTGKVYHHASTQFGQRERPVPKTEHLRTRDTQTCKIKSRTVQTTNECGTQMARLDMHFDNERDTFKTAGEYQTAVQYWRVRERKTVTIQRFWRGFSARSRVWSRREEKWEQKEKEMEVSMDVENKKIQQRQREMQRRMDPSTVQDFEVLYNDLDRWRDDETKRIKQSEVGERRQLALGELLHKETRLLQTIDRLKITAAHEGKERRTRRMLELMSTPKQWQMGDGEVAEITTPWTKRARELQDLHEALEAPLLSIEERLDVLLHLKWTVGEFDCRLTRDIAELVDREADLLSRGRGEASLRPLRQRIRNLFLRFAETPDFNPEATRFVRVPPKYKKLTDKGVAGLTSVSC